MRYEKEQCAHCGEDFRPDTDDIVVCPACGAPLHRACWNARGDCPFAAEHGEFVWEPSAPPEPGLPPFDPKTDLGVICPTCGENCRPGANHCHGCGADFADVDLERMTEQDRRLAQAWEDRPRLEFMVNNRRLRAEDAIDGVAVEEAAVYMRGSQRTLSRYLSRFERDRPLGWNWAAFLLGPFWFLYRKLYKPGLILAAALLVISAFTINMQQAFVTDCEEIYLPALERAAKNADISPEERGTLLSASRRVYHAHRAFLGLYFGSLALSSLFSALFADRLLRRKVWRGVAEAHDEVAGEGTQQKLMRQRILLRRGGFSFFAPMVYVWAGIILPGMLNDLVHMLIR
ncbi:MAG: DUF2628 domain-containing protein [Oscillospiraceae bacterium]|nr:DUF2628 domain-containing protein [Oscillospiraceae bacterium]